MMNPDNQLNNTLDTSQNSNAAVTSPSFPPATKKTPSKKKYLIIGLAAFSLLGIILVAIAYSIATLDLNAKDGSTDKAMVIKDDTSLKENNNEPLGNIGDSLKTPTTQASTDEDTDEDALPDWLEIKMGTNPNKFECYEHILACGNSTDFTNKKIERQNLIIILDSSGSMNATVGGGKNRLDVAKEAILEYVSQFQSTSVDLGLVVYGHKGNNSQSGKSLSCAGIETFYKPKQVNVSDFRSSISTLKPTGWTPIAASLQLAQAELKSTPGATTENSAILLVTDGEETCDGDPVSVAKSIYESGLKVVVDVIALGTNAQTDTLLKPIADAGGGTFVSVQNVSEFKKKLYEEFRLAQKETANVISCNSKIMREWTQCRMDLLDKYFYPYLKTLPLSEKSNNLMSFDKDKIDVHDKYMELTREINDFASEKMHSAGDQYEQNSDVFEPQ